jgi:hypothetical protein
MDSIRKNWLKQYGYTPTDNEILSLYRSGGLTLTDKQENDLTKHFNF